MSIRFSLAFTLCFLALGTFVVAGCGPTDPVVEGTETSHSDDHEGHDHDHEGHDHDDHDHNFETLAEAMAEVDELSTEIGKAFSDGEPEAAHDALHHIGDVLGAAEKMVQESKLAGEAKEAASKAVEDLFESFEALDESLHGKEGKAFDEVKEKIQAAIATLKDTSVN